MNVDTFVCTFSVVQGDSGDMRGVGPDDLEIPFVVMIINCVIKF